MRIRVSSEANDAIVALLNVLRGMVVRVTKHNGDEFDLMVSESETFDNGTLVGDRVDLDMNPTGQQEVIAWGDVREVFVH